MPDSKSFDVVIVGASLAGCTAARLFALDLQQPGTGVDGNERSSRSHNINLNGGASYDLSRSTRVNASANLNQVAGAAGKSRSANQSAGISYQPEGIALGQAHYGWSTSAQATNGSSQLGGGRQLALQLNHHLGYSTKLGGGSTLGMDGSQSASVVSSTAASEVSRQLTNSASLSWNMPGAAGTNSVLRLSASDTRSFGARTEFFQLVNLQANSNLARGAHSSWSGTLTVNGTDLRVDPSTTWGSRDRSWGVRPVGEKEPDGIRQGALEASNVNVVQELVDMIETQRAYEINSKMVQATDEMLRNANQSL